MRPLSAVVGELIDELVLQQHVGVAVARFDNERRRLRFAFGERGWEMLPGVSPSRPGLTADRLVAAADLLNDLASLAPTEDGCFEVTEDWRGVLGRFVETQTAG